MAGITLDGTIVGAPVAATPGPVVVSKAYGVQTTDGNALNVPAAAIPIADQASCDVSVIARSALYSRTFRVGVSARAVGEDVEITGIDVIRPPQGDFEAVAWMIDFTTIAGALVPTVIGEAGVTITWDIEIVTRTSSS